MFIFNQLYAIGRGPDVGPWPEYRSMEPVSSVPKVPPISLEGMLEAMKVHPGDEYTLVYNVDETPDFVIQELAAAVISDVPTVI